MTEIRKAIMFSLTGFTPFLLEVSINSIYIIPQIYLIFYKIFTLLFYPCHKLIYRLAKYSGIAFTS